MCWPAWLQAEDEGGGELSSSSPVWIPFHPPTLEHPTGHQRPHEIDHAQRLEHKVESVGVSSSWNLSDLGDGLTDVPTAARNPYASLAFGWLGGSRSGGHGEIGEVGEVGE